MNWLDRYRRGRAVRALAGRLPQVLAANWGGSTTYKVGQIERALELARLKGRWDAVAFAAFLSPEDYDDWAAKSGEALGYDAARELFSRARPAGGGGYVHAPIGNQEAASRYGPGAV